MSNEFAADVERLIAQYRSTNDQKELDGIVGKLNGMGVDLLVTPEGYLWRRNAHSAAPTVSAEPVADKLAEAVVDAVRDFINTMGEHVVPPSVIDALAEYDRRRGGV